MGHETARQVVCVGAGAGDAVRDVVVTTAADDVGGDGFALRAGLEFVVVGVGGGEGG